MAKGDSGRIVVDVDPALKRRLYSALAMEDCTLKDWFIAAAESYLSGDNQPSPRSKKTQKKQTEKR
jgi:hypothetical protein